VIKVNETARAAKIEKPGRGDPPSYILGMNSRGN
jgi:hypothetical protein